MKKIVMTICIIVILGITAVLAMALTTDDIDFTEKEIAIISDLHIKSETFFTDEQSHLTYANLDKMIHLSEAIAKTIVDEILENDKITTVLVPGDITENGDYESHLAAARILKRLTDAGKKVYTINGNHDAPSYAHRFPSKITTAQYREIYHDLGYSDAITLDSDSLSYVADLDEKFRIIAIDNDYYFNEDINAYKEEMDERLHNWIKDQLILCKEAGKQPLVFAHKPLLNSLPELVIMVLGEHHRADYTFLQLATMLADNGANYIFTGHGHSQSITSMTTENGNIFYDIQTASSLYMPCAYRTVSITNKTFKLKTHYIEKLNMDYVSLLNTPQDYAMIESDFRAYAKNHFKNGLNLLHLASGNYLVQLLNLSGTNADAVRLVADNAIKELLTLPLYIKDESSGKSIERIVKENGGNLPVSDYKTFEELASFFVMSITQGDRNINTNTVELELLNYSFKVLIYFINQINEEISDIFDDTPLIEIDTQRLFEEGKLEVIDSNLIIFFYTVAKDFLPSAFNNLTFRDLNALKILIRIFANEMIPGLGDSIADTMGEKEIDFISLLNNVVYDFLLTDFLLNEGNCNVIINRKTLELTVY